jgi:hypothetical protein
LYQRLDGLSISKLSKSSGLPLSDDTAFAFKIDDQWFYSQLLPFLIAPAAFLLLLDLLY